MKKLYVELADSPLKREYGLKDRHSLADNHGMLFKFPHHSDLGFWMQDTYLPLEIAFISDDGKIFQISEMIPLSTRPVYAKQRCKYALEVKKGWFRDNGVTEGSYLSGFGIRSNGESQLRFAQNMDQMSLEGIDTAPEVQQDDPAMQQQNTQQQPQEQAQQEQPDATTSQMSFSFKKRFQRVNAHNRLSVNAGRLADVLVIYQTEEASIVLLPRVIQGPFTFQGGVNGELVLANDISPTVGGQYPNGEAWACEPGLKTLLLNNILSMQEVKRNDSTQEQQIIAWMKELPEANQMQDQQFFEWMPETNR
ncbi:MAG TPA: DUF192 domain-containing protein [Alphaproteobacteria bacterium]|nr:DUF192 domain-containing protein [Alphaproteobacteria bacterium]